MAWNLGSRLFGLERAQTHLQTTTFSLKKDTLDIKSMMTEMYQAFKGQASTPSSSVPTTLAITYLLATVGGENDTHTDGEHIAMEDDKVKEEPTIEVTLIESTSKPPLADPILENQDLDEPIRVPYMINGKMQYLTVEEINAYLEKEDKIKKATEEAKMLEMTRIKVIKVVQEEAEKIRLDPKAIKSAKEGKRYERLMKILEELRIQSALPAPVPEQAPFESSGRKRKHIELEPEIKVPGLECNRSLPEGVPFVNNMVIEEPEYGIFFIDVFGDQAFQR
ncbi:hypothetical protein Tco_0341722 [Tanacetum coccineum]